MQEKRKLVLSVMLGVAGVLTALGAIIGLTYAYFTADVRGNNEASSIIATTATLKIHFTDTEIIDMPNALPGTSKSKEFKIENIGTYEVHYNVRWSDIVNTFVDKSDLVFQITKKDGTDMTGLQTVPSENEYVTGMQDIKIDVGETQEYVLTVTFKETGSNQNNNQGKTFAGKLQVLEFNPREADALVINQPVLNGLEVNTTLEDNRSSIVAYAITYGDPEAAQLSNTKKFSVTQLKSNNEEYKVQQVLRYPTTWIPVAKTSRLDISLTLEDYDAILWVKNEEGIIKYEDLTPYSDLIVNPNGGTWDIYTVNQTYNLRYKTTKTINNPTKEGYTFLRWNATGSDRARINGTTFTMGERVTTLTAQYSANPYNLTVDPAGGVYNESTTPTTIPVDCDEEVTVVNPTREGHTFTGWTKSSDKAVLNGTTLVMGAEACTLTATWEVNDYPYIVYHNKQNVTGSGYTLVSADTEEGTRAYGTVVNPNTKTYDGFTSPQAQSLTIRTSNNVLNYNYARNKYDLIINPNGGSYNSTTLNTTYNIYYQQEQSLLTPTRLGYNASWSKTGSGTLTDNTLTQGAGTTTLTAQWTAATYTVTFNANGGSTPTPNKTVTYNATYGTLPTPTRENYTFEGWFTATTGGTQITDASTVTITSAQTLYAQWTELKWTLNRAAFCSANPNKLNCSILADNPEYTTQKVTSDTMFQSTATTDQGLWTENRAGKTEGNLPTYFYRGDINNNYVDFAKKKWRIVRINEDGSVKLILGGNSASDGYGGTTAFNSNYDSAAYVDYNHPNNALRASNQDWYTNSAKGNLNAYELYIADTKFCNDKSGSTSAYGAYGRLKTNKTPQYKCPNASDNYVYKIGALTADEVAYAGGLAFINNSSYYLYDNAENEYVTGLWWLLSPYYYDFGIGRVFAVYGGDYPGYLYHYSINNTLGFRPVISLKPDTKILKGDGSFGFPYQITE